VFASAAACTVGTCTLPVYEIYKVGKRPGGWKGWTWSPWPGCRWPLCPLRQGRHPRHPLLLHGQRRLRTLEELLPNDTAILGVDEHTAAVLDLNLQVAVMTGRGGLTVRRRGRERTWPSGATVSLAELRRVVAGRSGRAAAQARDLEADADEPAEQETAPVPLLPQVVDGCAEAFQRAYASRDATGMVAAILDLDRAIADWSADTSESDNLHRAHSILRALVVRLDEAAGTGLRDPAEAHVELHDQPDGTVWELRGTHRGRQRSRLGSPASFD
jgi:hypothetical protein